MQLGQLDNPSDLPSPPLLPPPLFVLGTGVGVTVGVAQSSPLSPHGSIVGVGVMVTVGVAVGLGFTQLVLNQASQGR